MSRGPSGASGLIRAILAVQRVQQPSYLRLSGLLAALQTPSSYGNLALSPRMEVFGCPAASSTRSSR